MDSEEPQTVLGALRLILAELQRISEALENIHSYGVDWESRH